jgi:hypothetical protein
MSTGESTDFGALLRRYQMAAHMTQKHLAARHHHPHGHDADL